MPRRDLTLTRRTLQLVAISEVGERIRAIPELPQQIALVAEVAGRIFAVDQVVVESFDHAGVPVRAEHRDPPRAGPRPALEVPLEPRRLGRVGAIRVVGPRRGRFDDDDAGVLTAYAHGVAAALEIGRLTRRSSDLSSLQEDIMSAVFHDFRGPLGTVVLGAAVLRATFASRGEVGGVALVTLDRVERGCRVMQRLLEDLQDLALVDAGSYKVERRRARAGEVFEAVFESIGKRAEALGVTLTVVAPDDSLHLRVDSARVAQALEYLALNAFVVVARGGAVTISVETAGDTATFSVADTGPGLSDADAANAFDRTWRGPQGWEGQRSIRLLLVRAIAEAHGGRATVTSEQGRGSAFRITLPLDR